MSNIHGIGDFRSSASNAPKQGSYQPPRSNIHGLSNYSNNNQQQYVVCLHNTSNNNIK